MGGRAQVAAMREVVKKLKIEYEHFMEVEVFTKFGAKLDKETLAVLRRGERLREVLKQERFKPMPAEEQVCVFYALGQGCLDGMELVEVWPFLHRYLKELHTLHDDLMEEIRGGMTLSSRMKARLDKVINRLTVKKPGTHDIEQGTGQQEKEL